MIPFIRLPVKAHSISIIFFRLLFSCILSSYLIIFVAEPYTTVMSVLRFVLPSGFVIMNGAPLFFRLANIFFTFYINYLKVKMASLNNNTIKPPLSTSSSKQDQQLAEYQDAERKLRIAKIMNSVWLKLLFVLLFIGMYLINVLIVSVYMGLNFEAFKASLIVNYFLVVYAVVDAVIIISMCLIILIGIFRLRVADNFGVIKSIIVTIIVDVCSLVILVAFGILSVFSSTSATGVTTELRVYCYILFTLIISLEPIMYVSVLHFNTLYSLLLFIVALVY